MQSVSGVGKLSDGKVDAVGLLFSDEGYTQYPTYPDWDQDAYDIGMQPNANYNNGPTQTVPILISSGLSGWTALQAGDIARWQWNPVNKNYYYRCVVRGLVTKMPGFTFSGLNTIRLIGNEALISTD